MTRRPRSLQVSRGRGRTIPFVVLVAAAGLSGGCVLNGDFGRIRPEIVGDNMHDWVGRDAAVAVGGPVSEFRTTDQERELRDRAYALIEPPYNRGRWDSVFREYGLGNDPVHPEPFDRTEYLYKLHKVYRRSEASDYAQLVTDARNDVDRLQPFFAVAGRVTDMDRRRKESLAHVSNVKPREGANAVIRIKENALIVAWVCQALKERVVSYRFALERLVVAVPASEAAEADRAIGLLATRIDQYCGIRGGTVAVRG